MTPTSESLESAIEPVRSDGKQERVVRLLNAITEAVREMEKCPDDSTQDIWNEALESWETGLRMNHRLEVKRTEKLSGEEPRQKL